MINPRVWCHLSTSKTENLIVNDCTNRPRTRQWTFYCCLISIFLISLVQPPLLSLNAHMRAISNLYIEIAQDNTSAESRIHISKQRPASRGEKTPSRGTQGGELIKKSQKRQSREGTWAQMGPESVTVNPLALSSCEMRESVAA
jgi:hypothetical protein